MLKERVSTFASVCAEKLRKQKSCCHTIIVMLVIDNHLYKSSKYYLNSAVTLPFATNSTLTIANTALAILKKIHEGNEGIRFKKAGVIVSSLTPEDSKQFNMFEDENPKHLQLMETIDLLNKKIGNRKIKLGNQNPELTWDMNQNHLSSRYTTNFNEILQIECP